MLLNDNLKSLGGGAKAAAREAIMDRYSSILPSLSKGYTTLPAKKAGIQRFVFFRDGEVEFLKFCLQLAPPEKFLKFLT